MKKIEISSTQTIVVVPNLKVKDLTDPNAPTPNKLRAFIDNGTDLDKPVKILQGVHVYDAHITEWNTVKALRDNKIITFGREFNEYEAEPQTQSTPAQVKNLRPKPGSKLLNLDDLNN